MGTTELLELCGLPPLKAVSRSKGLNDPSIDRKTFQPAEAKQCDAGGHLWTNARKQLQLRHQC